MPRSAAITVNEYLRSLPDMSRAEVSRVRDVILGSLPEGYVEGMAYGMIYYFVPLTRYPATYNGQPLGYVGLAAQKRYNAIHLMGVYGDSSGVTRLQDAFAMAGKRLDMGKACVRFKRADDLALDAIAASIASLPVDDYISLCERSRAASRKS